MSRPGSRPTAVTMFSDSGLEMRADEEAADGGVASTGRGDEVGESDTQSFDADAHFPEIQKKRYAEFQEEARRLFPHNDEWRGSACMQQGFGDASGAGHSRVRGRGRGEEHHSPAGGPTSSSSRTSGVAPHPMRSATVELAAVNFSHDLAHVEAVHVAKA